MTSPDPESDTSTDAWEAIDRAAVVERIEADVRDIGEEFDAVAAKIRRDEPLEEKDIEQMRRAITHAEYHLDDILEPLAAGDDVRPGAAAIHGVDCGTPDGDSR